MLAGCAADPFRPLPAGAFGTPIELRAAPFFPQDEYQCGPAALATVLGSSGVSVLPDDLVSQVYVPTRRGSFQAEMMAASREHGRLPYVISPALSALLAEVEGGRPVLVLQNLGVNFMPAWHYAVVVGFSRERSELILRSGTDRRRVTGASVFARTWQRSGNWGMVALRPGELPQAPDRERYLKAAAAAEAAGHLDLATPAYAAATARWPGSAFAYLGLGNVAYGRGEFEAAEEWYRKALGLDPGDAAILNNLASALLKQGRCSEAARLLRPAAGQPTPDSRLAAALADTRAELATCPQPQRDHQPPRF